MDVRTAATLAVITTIMDATHPSPRKADISWMRHCPERHSSLQNYLFTLAGQYMDDQEHEEIYEENANRWFELFTNLTLDEARQQYPDIAAAYDAAI